jgi:hypothetical protein
MTSQSTATAGNGGAEGFARFHLDKPAGYLVRPETPAIRNEASR